MAANAPTHHPNPPAPQLIVDVPPFVALPSYDYLMPEPSSADDDATTTPAGAPPRLAKSEGHRRVGTGMGQCGSESVGPPAATRAASP